MTMNALNGVSSDIYTLQVTMQEKLQKLKKILQKILILKTYNFQSKLEIFTKLKKGILLSLALLVIKKR